MSEAVATRFDEDRWFPLEERDLAKLLAAAEAEGLARDAALRLAEVAANLAYKAYGEGGKQAQYD